MKAQDHWEEVYRENDPRADVSWFQSNPEMSLKLIRATGISRSQPVIDVGGGASLLVDFLLDEGFEDISVLDISCAAIEHAKKRLAERAVKVNWLHADITTFAPSREYTLWHDRAVFHFLTSDEARRSYVRVLERTLSPVGHFVLGTFAEDGPTRCSGLPVMRYDAPSICAELGSGFQICGQERETHVTPWNSEQKFNWFRFRRRAANAGSLEPAAGDRPGDRTKQSD